MVETEIDGAPELLRLLDPGEMAVVADEHLQDRQACRAVNVRNDVMGDEESIGARATPMTTGLRSRLAVEKSLQDKGLLS